jgi:hypothetical protein
MFNDQLAITEAITPKLLRQAFSCWRRAQDLPSPLSQLRFLSDTPLRPAATQHNYWYDTIVDLVSEQLGAHRAIAQIAHGETPPQTPAAIKAQLARDFDTRYRKPSRQLTGWSALFHRYLLSLNLSPKELARAAGISDRQYRRHLEMGLRLLAQTLQQLELATYRRSQRADMIRSIAPVDYEMLVGREGFHRQLQQSLLTSDSPLMISIEGLGGMGKTTLAHWLVHQLSSQKAGILWVTIPKWEVARGGRGPDQRFSTEDVLRYIGNQLRPSSQPGVTFGEQMAQLQSILLHQPHWVVIDGFEHLDNPQTALYLFRSLAGVTRFLFTSRYTLGDYSCVRSIRLPEFSLKDTEEFLRWELARTVRGRSMSLGRQESEQIFQIVGGIPLALKKIARQLQHRPLSSILASLRGGDSASWDSLYRHVCFPSWQRLDAESRDWLHWLTAMTDADRPVSWKQLASERDFGGWKQQLQQLVDVSLVDVIGSSENPQYLIRPLVRTFLQRTFPLARSDRQGGVGQGVS